MNILGSLSELTEKPLLPRFQNLYLLIRINSGGLEEKPENSKVCEEASEETEMFALNALAFVGSVTETPTAYCWNLP